MDDFAGHHSDRNIRDTTACSTKIKQKRHSQKTSTLQLKFMKISVTNWMYLLSDKNITLHCSDETLFATSSLRRLTGILLKDKQ
jgi:hypothetical protein